MTTFSVFDAETGRILRSGSCLESDMQLQSAGPSEIVTEGAYRNDEWHMVEGQPVKRPTIHYRTSTTLGSTILRLLDPPAGTEVVVRGPEEAEHYVVDDGEFAYATDFPGEYQFEIMPPFPYQLQVIQVRVS